METPSSRAVAFDPINPIVPGMVGDVRRSNVTARRDIDHWHEVAEFDLVLRGSGTIAFDSRSYVLRPGTMIWMAPGERHKLTRGAGLEMWVVVFEPRLLEANWLADLAAQPSRELSGHELLSIDRLLSEVAQDSDEAAAYNAGIVYAVMRALRASRDRPPASLKVIHPAVARALMLMRHEDNASSLSDLAAAAGVAAPYLSRLLVEHTGRSFVDWRNRIRLDRFLQDCRPGTNLLNAALDAGFGSYARFHHVFAEVIGCPPSEWMARLEAGKVVARPGATAPLGGYGIPGAGLLSARQRWATLVPLVSPTIRAFLGEMFAERVATATPCDPGRMPAAYDDMDLTLTISDIEQFMASFEHEQLDAIEDYRRLIANHDFGRIYTGILRAYGMSPERLTDLITALMLLVWSCLRNHEVTPAQAITCRKQVEGALCEHALHVDLQVLREARVAMQCHYVIAYQALQAARASGEDRLVEQLRADARVWSHAVFGQDLGAADMTSEGIYLTPGIRPNVRTPVNV